MTSIDAARAALEQAQGLLDRVNADNARMDEFLTWVAESISRADELDAYYRGRGQDDIQTVLAADPGGVTPPVAGEDAVWEALAGFHDRMLQLLRVSANQVTSGLDDPDRC